MDLSLLPSLAHYSNILSSSSSCSPSSPGPIAYHPHHHHQTSPDGYPSMVASHPYVDPMDPNFQTVAYHHATTPLPYPYHHQHYDHCFPSTDPQINSYATKDSNSDTSETSNQYEPLSYCYLDNKVSTLNQSSSASKVWSSLGNFDETTQPSDQRSHHHKKYNHQRISYTSLVPQQTSMHYYSSECNNKDSSCFESKNPLLKNTSPSTQQKNHKAASCGADGGGEEENYITITSTNPNSVVKVGRRSANKKERRRTQSINSAFSNLRDCIPNVPADTKLSKIKTLRLATSYISYLMKLLEGPRENSTKLLSEGFRADLSNAKRSTQQNRIETQNEIQRQLRLQQYKQSVQANNKRHKESKVTKSSKHHHHHHHHLVKDQQPFDLTMEKSNKQLDRTNFVEKSSIIMPSANNPLIAMSSSSCSEENSHPHPILTDLQAATTTTRSRCRTSWPEHVWALELKNYDQ